MSSPLCSLHWNRRFFLKSSAAAVMAWPFADMRIGTAAQRKVTLSEYPFQLGVASGDPLPDGVVLWTRLAPQPLQPAGGMPPEDVPVTWRIARDEGFTDVVREGTTTASADWAHSVHVEVDGLEPDHAYFYQFVAAGEKSPTGRTRTTPRRDAKPSECRFAFASCQHFEAGLYTAYEHMAKDDLHAVIHLGDYIYEGKESTKGVRRHVGPEIKTLEDYRRRHALYKTDPHLQATHLAFPWIVTWDDHEFDNNCAGDVSEEKNVSSADFLVRRANAYKAYYEHMPLRKSALPKGPDMQIYRNLPYGTLADFCVLDTRQYLSDQPCGDGTKLQCPECFDPQMTMLGAQQEAWLSEQLTRSPATWNVLAQQVMVARAKRPRNDQEVVSMDQWGGYDVPRTRLLKFLQDAKISNPVVLTGDIHSNWVNDLKVDFDDASSPIIASEFVGTSISSGGDGDLRAEAAAAIRTINPFVHFHSAERGYVRCRVTPETWQSDYCAIPYVTRPGAPCEIRASFVVENGRPGPQQV